MGEETEIWRWGLVQEVGLPHPTLAVRRGELASPRGVSDPMKNQRKPTLGFAAEPPALLPLLLRNW